MKIAFLVTAHTNEQQLALLTDLLTSKYSDVYVHYDAKSHFVGPVPANMRMIPRIPVWHGGWSQVEASLNLIEAARARDKYDYFMFLSGQCFPVKPLSWLMERFSEKLDYISYYRMPIDRYARTLERLEYFHFERHHASWVHGKLNRIARRLPKRNFVKGLSLWPYTGSNWWAMRVSTINYCMDYIRRNPKFIAYLKRSTFIDELIFQSIISNMAIESELRNPLFCVEFDPKTEHPRIYTESDIEMLSAKDVFLARKLDSRIDSKIVDHFAAVYKST